MCGGSRPTPRAPVRRDRRRHHLRRDLVTNRRIGSTPRPLPAFATLLEQIDKDGNGQISQSELPPTLYIFSRPDVPDVPGASMPLSRVFPNMDVNKDGLVNDAEWQQA